MKVYTWDIAVGTEDCSTAALSRCLQETSVRNKLSSFGAILGMKRWELQELKLMNWYYNRTSGDCINKILDIWRSRYPSQAVFGVLLYHLLEIDCSDAVEALEEAFVPLTCYNENQGRIIQNDHVLLMPPIAKAPAKCKSLTQNENSFRRSKSGENLLSISSNANQLHGKFPYGLASELANNTCPIDIDMQKFVTKNTEQDLLWHHSSNEDLHVYFPYARQGRNEQLRKYYEKKTGRTNNHPNTSILICCSKLLWILNLMALVSLALLLFCYAYKIPITNCNVLEVTLAPICLQNNNPAEVLEAWSSVHDVYVHSHQYYAKEMSRLPISWNISVTMVMDKPEHWPLEKLVEGWNNVVELKIVDGYSVNAIYNVIQSHPNLRILHIVYSNTQFCQNSPSSKYQIDKRQSVSKVEKFFVESLDECEGLFQLLASKFKFENLQKLKISNGIISSSNLVFVQEMLRNSRQTLRHLEFYMTNWRTSAFNGKLGTLINLEFLRVDIAEDSLPYIEYINDNFHRIFPALKSFVSSTGLISWDQFVKLSKGKKIDSIQLNLNLTRFDGSVNLVKLISHFYNLKEANLFLDFGNANNRNVCSVEGYKEAKSKLRNFACDSNCISFEDTKRMEKNLLSFSYA